MAGLVYSYLRFSDPKQAEGHSSERQRAYAENWAKSHGLTLDESLSMRDEGLSAYHQAHVKTGALGVFLAAVQQGRIPKGSVLVVEGLDRLSRAEPIEAQAQLSSIISSGITVVTASDGKTYSREQLRSNPMDLVYSLIVMIRAHEESDTKSKRVTASLRRRCEKWSGEKKHQPVLNAGRPPSWLEYVDGEWRFIPERVRAVKEAIRLYRKGFGGKVVVRMLAEKNLSITAAGAKRDQVHRLITRRALIGDKEIVVDGVAFNLPGHYPALLTQEEWDGLQADRQQRGLRKVKGKFPALFTGLGIATCGYCGAGLIAQTIGAGSYTPGEKITDGHRRLLCSAQAFGECKVKGVGRMAPIERALMTYCSDVFNLQSLYGEDRTAGFSHTLAELKKSLADINKKLERLTDAMLSGGDEGAPLVFTKRARELEAEKQRVENNISQLEHNIAVASRADVKSVSAEWKRLRAGVENQDVEARLKARKLVADTFERLTIYFRGNPPAAFRGKCDVDMVVKTKGGQARLLRIDQEGKILAAEDVGEQPKAAKTRKRKTAASV